FFRKQHTPYLEPVAQRDVRESRQTINTPHRYGAAGTAEYDVGALGIFAHPYDTPGERHEKPMVRCKVDLILGNGNRLSGIPGIPPDLVRHDEQPQFSFRLFDRTFGDDVVPHLQERVRIRKEKVDGGRLILDVQRIRLSFFPFRPQRHLPGHGQHLAHPVAVACNFSDTLNRRNVRIRRPFDASAEAGKKEQKRYYTKIRTYKEAPESL